jgi:hypothetical protein
MESGEEEKSEMNEVAAYEMVQCEEIRLQYDQSCVEGYDHDAHRKILF